VEITKQQRDLVLAPNEFAWILDESKGDVNVWTGPIKTTISDTDRPVIFADGRFVQCILQEAVQAFSTVPEGSYLVLRNPAKDDSHPASKQNSGFSVLKWGE
jgi:major vault protein